MTSLRIALAIVATGAGLGAVYAQQDAARYVAPPADGARDVRHLRQISYHTVYQVTPLQLDGRAVRTISIEGEIGGAATLHLDGNQSQLSAYGDPYFSTMMAFHPLDVHLKPLAKGDPPINGRTLIDLECKTAGALKSRLRLSIPGDPTKSPRLLIMSDDLKQIKHMITLEVATPRAAP